jgi:hypothetical protein
VDDDNSTIYVLQGKFVGVDAIDAEPLREVLYSWIQLKDLVRLQETANHWRWMPDSLRHGGQRIRELAMRERR